MGLASSSMTQTAHAAPTTAVDKDNNRQTGAQKEITCRYEQSAEKVYDQGKIVDQKDRIYTHDEVGDNDVVWPPGADETDPGQGIVPSSVEVTPPLGRGDPLYKVVL